MCLRWLDIPGYLTRLYCPLLVKELRIKIWKIFKLKAKLLVR